MARSIGYLGSGEGWLLGRYAETTTNLALAHAQGPWPSVPEPSRARVATAAIDKHTRGDDCSTTYKWQSPATRRITQPSWPHSCADDAPGPHPGLRDRRPWSGSAVRTRSAQPFDAPSLLRLQQAGTSARKAPCQLIARALGSLSTWPRRDKLAGSWRARAAIFAFV